MHNVRRKFFLYSLYLYKYGMLLFSVMDKLIPTTAKGWWLAKNGGGEGGNRLKGMGAMGKGREAGL